MKKNNVEHKKSPDITEAIEKYKKTENKLTFL